MWGVQSTHRERRAVDGKFSAKPRARRRMEARERARERERERESNIKGEANPQKPFDISHQRAILTCLTLHFQLDAKSSAWGCHSLMADEHQAPAAVFDRFHQFPRVFLKAHTFQPHAGDFFRRQEMSFCDLQWGIDGGLKQEQWSMLMDYPFCTPICKDLKSQLNGLARRQTPTVFLINGCKSKLSSCILSFFLSFFF